MFEVIAEKNEYVQKFVIVVLVLLFFSISKSQLESYKKKQFQRRASI